MAHLKIYFDYEQCLGRIITRILYTNQADAAAFDRPYDPCQAFDDGVC